MPQSSLPTQASNSSLELEARANGSILVDIHWLHPRNADSPLIQSILSVPIAGLLTHPLSIIGYVLDSVLVNFFVQQAKSFLCLSHLHHEFNLANSPIAACPPYI